MSGLRGMAQQSRISHRIVFERRFQFILYCTVNVGLEGFAMPEEGRRQDSRGLHDGQQTDTTVRRTRRDGTTLSRLPTWPSCSNVSGWNEGPALAPAPSDIESNEARKASRLFPGISSMISHYSWSVIANSVLSMRSEKEEARPIACLRQPLQLRRDEN